jgi:hypothetical protein
MTRDPDDQRPRTRVEDGDIHQSCRDIMEDAHSISRASAKLLLMLMDSVADAEATPSSSPHPDRERPTIPSPRKTK